MAELSINKTDKSQATDYIDINGQRYMLATGDYVKDEGGKLFWRPDNLNRLPNYKEGNKFTLPQVPQMEFLRYVRLKNVKKAFQKDTDRAIQVFYYEQ